MQKNKSFGSLLLVLALMLGLTSCDKTKLYETAIPPQLVHFNTSGSVTYIVNKQNFVSLEVGTTDVANVDRQATFVVSSPTGAVLGTHYDLEGYNDTTGTFNFPAGATTNFLKIKAENSLYVGTGRKDTLIISLVTPGVPVADFKNSVTVIIKECNENIVTIEDFLGDYANSTDNVFDETYTANVSYAIATSPTSGKLKVKNLLNRNTENGDAAGPWGGVTLDLDWSDSTNKTVFVNQTAVSNSDAGDIFGADYNGFSAAIRQSSAAVGEFNYCDQTLTMRVNLGLFGDLSGTGAAFYWSSTTFTITLQR